MIIAGAQCKSAVMAGVSWLCSIAMLSLSACAIAPEPLSETDRETYSREVNERIIGTDQEPVHRPIDLYEAMARAIKYNLDQRVELHEAALRSEEATTAGWALLPQLVANGGYNGRNNFSGASSSALLGPRQIGEQSLVASTSSERNILTADLQATWNILDFGLSYVRAKQANDEYLIALEQRRRVVNQIIQEVRTAYWRAASAERLLERIQDLEAATDTALSESRDLLARKKTPPLATLTYQRELLSVKREVQQLHREIAIARAQLSALMNIRPDEEYSLVLPERQTPQFDTEVDLEALTVYAFQNRPEMRELIYRNRINNKEHKAVLLELLPSLELYGGANYDTNDFLFNSNWLAWGARVSWNLIQAVRVPQRRREIRAREQLIQYQSYALGMAIMTQMHVALWRFGFFTEEYDTAREYADVQGQIVQKIRVSAEALTVSKQTLIREEMNDLLAQIRYDIAYADLQNAFATIYATLGIDPFPKSVTGSEDISTLSAALRDIWQKRGDRSFMTVDELPVEKLNNPTKNIVPEETGKDRQSNVAALPAHTVALNNSKIALEKNTKNAKSN